MSDSARRTAVSLFTGAGIGDLGFRAAGFDFIVMSELDPPRAELAKLNFPGAEMVVGDLWEVAEQVVEATRQRLQKEGRDRIDLLSCTAPCQGMSKNGKGTLLRNARLGKRPAMDPRNRLILPALDVVRELRPDWVVFENVCEMANTLIEDRNGTLRLILQVIGEELGHEYRGAAYDVEFADYGIPQRRRRLITVYSRTELGHRWLDSGERLVPPRSHDAKGGEGLARWLPITDVLEGFPPLDAGTKGTAEYPSIPFHRVPLLDQRKYEWVRHTPTAASAFDNQCPACGNNSNARHGASRGQDGVNRAHADTPLHCNRCGGLLPRPHVLVEGEPRIMRGYTSAYKRMSPDMPAPALTRNLSYACSDQKLHPTQNRVLSLAEAFEIHTLSDFEYRWGPVGKKGRQAPDALIRLVLGESVPPRFLRLLGEHLVVIEEGITSDSVRRGQLALFGSNRPPS